MPDQKRGLLSTRDALLARSDALAAGEPNFARYLTYTVQATDAEDLAAYGPGQIEFLLRESYGRIGQRDPTRHVIHFWRPPGENSPEIIEVFSPDMPFLVDSVLGAIRAKGGAIRLMAHPVLPLDPESHRVLEGFDTPGAMRESMLHVHIDPLPTAEARAEMQREIDEVLEAVKVAVAGWRPMLERLRRVVADQIGRAHV